LTEAKSKAFSDLLLSMTDDQRTSMAADLLVAISDDRSVREPLVSISEALRVGSALQDFAREIEMHHPGGHNW